MKNALISLAGEEDIPWLNDLVNSAYRGDKSRKGWTSEADLLYGNRINKDLLISILQNPYASILKYEEENQLLGCVYFEKQTLSLYLGMLAVKPDAQTVGIGKKLITAVEQIAGDSGFKKVKITVISNRHKLIAFYERRGYKPTGEREVFSMSDHRFGRPVQDLSLMVLEKAITKEANMKHVI